jgi:hypothetical protein
MSPPANPLASHAACSACRSAVHHLRMSHHPCTGLGDDDIHNLLRTYCVSFCCDHKIHMSPQSHVWWSIPLSLPSLPSSLVLKNHSWADLLSIMEGLTLTQAGANHSTSHSHPLSLSLSLPLPPSVTATAGKYLKREVLNLARFISTMKSRPLTWRLVHPYVLADRMEVRRHRRAGCWGAMDLDAAVESLQGRKGDNSLSVTHVA